MIIYDPKNGDILVSTARELNEEEIKANLALHPKGKCLVDDSVESLSGYFITTKNKVGIKPE